MSSFPKLSFVCPMPWVEMRGDEKERFCSKCSRTVVNLSTLGEAERGTLLRDAKPEELCVAYYQRLSGEGVSADNPLSQSERRSVRQLGLAALSAGTLALAANCAAAPKHEVAFLLGMPCAKAPAKPAKADVKPVTREEKPLPRLGPGPKKPVGTPIGSKG